MRPTATLAILLLAFAGCLDGGSDGQDISLSATPTTGQAPLAVTFTPDLSGYGSNVTWTMRFGDGSESKGSGLPGPINHTYTKGGDFSAVFYVGTSPAAGNDSVTIKVEPGELPPTHFEWGPMAGCAPDAHGANPAVPINCVSYQAGPDAEPVDGAWIELDERYEGFQVKTTISQAGGQLNDSDCFFFAQDRTTELGNGNNADQPCGGVLPAGTRWVFLYPYAAAAQGMTADFSPK